MQALGQDRIPTDVLYRIFDLFTDDCTCTIPPKVLEPPWVLGQVCSKWRKVSRSILDLWKTRIVVKARKSSNSSASALPELEFDQVGYRALERATILLPSGSYISLDVVGAVGATSDFDGIHPNSLIPLLAFVKQLDWQVTFNPAFFHPGSLQAVERFKLSIRPPWNDNKSAVALSSDRFGASPKLQELHLKSTTPDFLYLGIPWSRLRSLTLDSWTSIPFLSSKLEIEPWRTFFMSISIDLSGLRELYLSSKFQLLEIIFRATIPWNQLTTLHIVSSDSFENLPLLFDVLRASTGLINLRIQGYKCGETYEQLDSLGYHPATLPALQRLIAPSITLPVITHLISSDFLLSLSTGTISLSDFYLVVQKCPRLTTLDSYITDTSDPLGSVAITLPCLTSLEIFFAHDPEWSSTSFPTLLVTPNIKSLQVTVHGSGSFPLSLTADLIKRSDAQISDFSGHIDEDISSFDSGKSLLELLTALEGAQVVKIVGIIFPQAILDELAAGSLLPRVKCLAFSVRTLEQMESTMNSRLLYEETCGRVNLQDISGFIEPKEDDDSDEHSDDDDSDEHLDAGDSGGDSDTEEEEEPLSIAARKIKEKYGVECELSYRELA